MGVASGSFWAIVLDICLLGWVHIVIVLIEGPLGVDPFGVEDHKLVFVSQFAYLEVTTC